MDPLGFNKGTPKRIRVKRVLLGNLDMFPPDPLPDRRTACEPPNPEIGPSALHLKSLLSEVPYYDFFM